MSAPVVVGPGVVWSVEVCAELGPDLASWLERVRRDRVPLSPHAVATIEASIRGGQLWRPRSVPHSSDPVPLRDTTGSEPEHWITVRQASEILGIGSRAVTKRIDVGSVVAVKARGAWRIDPSSLGKEIP